jgi:hypothetical protein
MTWERVASLFAPLSESRNTLSSATAHAGISSDSHAALKRRPDGHKVVVSRPGPAESAKPSMSSIGGCTHASVAAQALVPTGLISVQLVSTAASLPSLAIQDTTRVSVASDSPQLLWQSGNSGASQLYVTQTPVAAQILVSTGRGSVQLESP